MRICKVTKNIVITTRIYNHFLLKKNNKCPQENVAGTNYYKLKVN